MSVTTPEPARPRNVAPLSVQPEPPPSPVAPVVAAAPAEAKLLPLWNTGDAFGEAPAIPALDTTPQALRALQKASMASLGWEAGRMIENLDRLKRPTRFTPSMSLRQVAAPLLPMFNSALGRTGLKATSSAGRPEVDLAEAAARAFELMEREHDFPLSSLRKVELLELAAGEGAFKEWTAEPDASALFASAGGEVSRTLSKAISREALQRAAARPPTGVPPGLWSYAAAFYDGVQMAALPAQLALRDPLKGTDFDDGPWFVDHGPNHHRNVVEQIAPTLDAILKSGLIPARDRPERVKFMESTGRMVAALHDVWMVDCSGSGKREHAWRVGRETFTDDPRLTREVELLAKGDFGKTLTEVYGISGDDLPITVRELLSLGFAHSKSSVGLAPLEDPRAFRKLAQEMLLREDPKGYGVTPQTCIAHYGSVEALKQNSFRWLEENPELAADAIDAVRVVRTADGLRWRGIDFRGHLGGQIALAAKGKVPYNLFRLTDPERGTTYVVRYADGPHMGETNSRIAEVADDGSIRLGIRTGGGDGKGAAILAQRTADGFFASIWREFAGSFSDARNRRIVIEAPDEPGGIAFAQKVAREMLGSAERSLAEAQQKVARATPEKRAAALEKLEAAKLERDMVASLGARGLIQVAPARPLAPGALQAREAATRLEADRFAAFPDAKFSSEELSSLKQLLDDGGVNTGPMNMARAMKGAKRLKISRGEALMARGGRSDFVYVPLASDAFEMGLVRGYPALPVARGVPIGELDAVAEQPREADWVALEDTEVLAIPASTYRREWAPYFYTRDLKDENGKLRWPGNILSRLRRDYGHEESPTAAAA